MQALSVSVRLPPVLEAPRGTVGARAARPVRVLWLNATTCRRPALLRENLRLLQGGKLATVFTPAVVNESGIGPLRPAPRSLILLSGKHG